MLTNLRIVLVEPTGPANVGAVCRAMKNMGLTDLVLVAPKCDPLDEAAIAYATRGKAVLDSARVVDDIPAALAGCVSTFATSSKLGLYRRQAALVPAEAAELAVAAAVQGPVALAFGRESWGLRTRELLYFDRIVTIPADPDYPVINLAAAVMVMCYELRRAWLAAEQHELLPMALNRDVAPDEKKQVFYEQLFDGLDRIDFFSEQSPDKLKYALRHLFGRIDLSTVEVDILIGMARQIQWYARHHPQRVDPA